MARERASAVQLIHLRSDMGVALLARELSEGFRYQTANTIVAIGGYLNVWFLRMGRWLVGNAANGGLKLPLPMMNTTCPVRARRFYATQFRRLS